MSNLRTRSVPSNLQRLVAAAIAVALTVAVGAGCKAGGGSAPVGSLPKGATSVSVAGAGQVRVVWSANSSNQTGFRVEQSTDSVNFARVAQVDAFTTSVTVSGLLPATTYYFRVKAYNAAGESGPSPAMPVTTLSSSAAN